MTKKPIDITGKLPAVHVHEPWRQKMPVAFAKRFDDLIAALGSLQTLYNNIGVMEQELSQALRDTGERALLGMWQHNTFAKRPIG